MTAHFAALENTLLANPLSRWLNAIAVAVVVAVLLYLVKHLVGRRLAALAPRTETELDDVASELLARTRFYFILALALLAGSRTLSLETPVRAFIADVTSVAVLLQFARWGTGLVAFWLRRWSRARGAETSGLPESTTINAVGALATGTIWAVVLLLALRNIWNFDITALVTGLGIGGIAIALAVQNILGDLFAALSIVLDKPFDVGDVIGVDTFTGTVEHVGLKTTRVRSINGEQLIFSNSDLLKARLRNFRGLQQRRVLFTIGVTYDTPAAVIRRILDMIRSIITANDATRFDRAHFARFTDSALQFEAVYFVTDGDYGVYMDVQQRINLALLERFAAERIEFAFPTQTVIHRSPDGPAGGRGDGESPTESSAPGAAVVEPAG